MRTVSAGLLFCLVICPSALAINAEPTTTLRTICIDGNDAELSCGEGNGGGTRSGSDSGSGGSGTFLRSLGLGEAAAGGPSGGSGSGGVQNPNREFHTYGGNSDAPATNVEIVTFSVKGQTAAALNKSMRGFLDHGRIAETYIRKSPWRLSKKVTVRNGMFAVAELKLSLSIRTYLPQWNKKEQKGAPKCLVRQFQKTVQQLAIHEQHHAKAYRRLQARVWKRVKALPEMNNLQDLNKKVLEIYHQEKAAIEAEENRWHYTADGAYSDPLKHCL